MKQKLAILFLGLISIQVQAFDSNLLKSDKEISSNFLNQSKVKQAEQLVSQSFNSLLNFKQQYPRILANAIEKSQKFKSVCDEQIVSLVKSELYSKGAKWQENAYEGWAQLARQHNLIDDIMAEMLVKTNSLVNKLAYFSKNPARPVWHARVKFKVDDKKELLDFYKKIQDKWPDGKNECFSSSFGKLAALVQKAYSVKPGNTGYLHKALISTNLYALNTGIIDLATWNKLEVLRNQGVLENRLSFSNYLDNLKNAKNKLIGELEYIRKHNPEVVASHQSKRYLSTYVNRAKQLTRRKQLYSKYNSQQILLLADIMVKASKRMNADKAEIHIDYREDEGEGPDEVYLISPMEQYRMSLKMLRKDYSNASLSSLFAGTNVEYEDIVMASFETGAISLDELDFVIQYEQFWNPPKDSIWKTIVGYVFDFTGTATLFLPAPYNVIGAIGLVYTQTKLFQKQNEADASGNANSIF